MPRFVCSNSLSGINGTLARGGKEHLFHQNDHGGSSTIPRKLSDGREKETTHLFESNRKFSSNTSLKPYRSKRETETLIDEAYNNNNYVVRYVKYANGDSYTLGEFNLL